MATRVYPTTGTTFIQAIPSVYGIAPNDIGFSPGSSSAQITFSFAQTPSPELKYMGAWVTERFASQFTISNDITFVGWTNVSGTVRFRIIVSKFTVGGSDVETIIGQGDGTTDIINAVANTVTIPVPIPVTVAKYERLYHRIYMFLSSGTTWPATGGFVYNAPSGTNMSYFDYVEALPSRISETQTLWLRRSTTIGIGNFMDALPARGSLANTTAVVATTSGATQKQWTKTSGGALAEWVSQRLAIPWSMASIGNVSIKVFAFEGGTSANTSIRFRLFRRKPDGTELEFASSDFGAELPTTASQISLTMTTFTAMTLDEDDRIVLRAYAIPATGLTMGNSTATMQYDGNSATDQNSTIITLSRAAPTFKAETDSGKATPLPSGTSMMGMGNGM